MNIEQVTKNPDRVILMYAMSRSGHHATINWIQEQLPGTSYFFNHCWRDWNKKRLVPHLGFDKGVHIVGDGEGPTTVIYNIEEFCPFMWQEYDFDSFEQLNSSRLDIVCQFRDPYNLMASSLDVDPKPHVLYKNELGVTATRTTIYELQVMEYKVPREKKYIPHEVIDLNYNKWFVSEDYRKELCKKLNIPFTDAGLQHVPSSSSFDGMAYTGKAQDMGVLERWKKFEKEPRYWYSLSPVLVEFAYSYFDGLNPLGLFEIGSAY